MQGYQLRTIRIVLIYFTNNSNWFIKIRKNERGKNLKVGDFIHPKVMDVTPLN